MAARDRFHEAVKIALQKENWVITDDPLKLEAGRAQYNGDASWSRVGSNGCGEGRYYFGISSALRAAVHGVWGGLVIGNRVLQKSARSPDGSDRAAVY